MCTKECTRRCNKMAALVWRHTLGRVCLVCHIYGSPIDKDMISC